MKVALLEVVNLIINQGLGKRRGHSGGSALAQNSNMAPCQQKHLKLKFHDHSVFRATDINVVNKHYLNQKHI